MLRIAFGVFLALLVITKGEARQVVSFDGYYPGSIVIDTSARKLYFITAPGQAISYPVGVGMRGKQWTGITFIEGKRANPAWSPPAIVKRDKPWLPNVIPPGPENPMGTRAILLEGGEYAIHGTNKPDSVGGFVSYGCFRMYNHDIEELYSMVQVGAPVIVVR